MGGQRWWASVLITACKSRIKSVCLHYEPNNRKSTVHWLTWQGAKMPDRRMEGVAEGRRPPRGLHGNRSGMDRGCW